MSLQSTYDIVIIGSGAGGGTVADVVSRETDPETDILVLEGGPLWRPEQFNETERDMGRLYFSRGAKPSKNLPGFGAEHERFMRRYTQMMSILILADDPPRADNRITTDRSGDPVIDYTVPAPVRPALAKGLRRSVRIFMAAGCTDMMLPGSRKDVLTLDDADRLDTLITPDTLNFHQSPLSSAHPQGGARMGDDPAEAVVAPDGRLHGLDSVYVADAFLFPTSVKVNSYETVMLLATHVGETVADRM